jgi:hypothetical protein
MRDEDRFHECCLLMPSEELRSVAAQDTYGHLKFEFHPVDNFRLQLANLRTAIEDGLPGEN